MQHGPIDAQSVLIKEMLFYQYEKSDLGVAMSIIESVCKYSLPFKIKFSHYPYFLAAFLVHSHILNAEKVYCQRSVDASTTNNVFNNLFATVLGSENARQNTTVSDNSLLVCLLRLSSLLVQTALPTRRGAHDDSMATDSASEIPSSSHRSSNASTSNDCQTDETKAEQQQHHHQEAGPSSAANTAPLAQPSTTIRVPCVADTVLQHYPTMNRLLGSLSQSNSTPFLETTFYPTSNDSTNTAGAPTTVVDAVFQLLMLLSRKATQPTLVIKPLYDFLKSSK